MQADALNKELNQSPFEPVRLCLMDGTVVDVATPYLSFIQPGGRLYIARASRPKSAPIENVELIPVADISHLQRTS
jgi:hypothetical protein